MPFSVLVGCKPDPNRRLRPVEYFPISASHVTNRPFSFTFQGHLSNQISNLIFSSPSNTEIEEAQVSEIGHVQSTNILHGIDLHNYAYDFITVRLPGFIRYVCSNSTSPFPPSSSQPVKFTTLKTHKAFATAHQSQRQSHRPCGAKS